jgi:hypothetical protein
MTITEHFVTMKKFLIDELVTFPFYKKILDFKKFSGLKTDFKFKI